MMKSFLFLIILISQSTLARAKSIYFIEWRENLTNEQENKVNRILRNNNLIIGKDAWQIVTNDRVAKKLLRTNAFKFIEKDQLTKVDFDNKLSSNTKSLSGWNKTWHIDRINAPAAWTITEGSEDVIVAVCDSGVNKYHPELRGKVLRGWNFLNNNYDTSPNTNHGTAVSGFIAASNRDNYGTSGVAPRVKILPGKIVTTSGGVPTSAMLNCIRWAANKGAKVINVSMTGVNSSSSASAARYANKKGAVVVWAAGNQNWYTRWLDKPEIIAVAGTDIYNRRYYSATKNRAWGSNTGLFVDVAVPGEDLYFLTRYGGYYRGNGTSYSAPIVSGVAALIYSVNPNLTPKQVVSILKQSATYIGSRRSFGAGLVDAYKAVQLARETI